jgi:hypothetical protein
MGALTIGRVGLDLDLEATDLRLTSRQDSLLQIRGEVAPANSGEATSIRDELSKMADEGLILPVTLSSDPTIDGFYELSDVTLDVGIASLSGYYPFRASLRRLGSEGKIAIESRLTVGLRSNDHSINFGTSEPFWSAADIGDNTVELGAASGLTTLNRSASGSLTIVIYRDVPNTLLSIIHGQDAGNYYSGAAVVEVGATLRVVSGRDSENQPMNWRLSNGLIRVSPDGTNGRLSVEHFDGTVWETAKVYTLEEGGAEIGQWDYLAILRNDPAAVTIRLVERQAGAAPVYLDLTLRRGSRFIEGYLARQKDTATTSWNVEHTTAEAGTSLTGALRATANDADGNRYVIGSSKTMTKDTTQGGIAPTTNATNFPFFIGSAVAGSGAVAGDTPADLVNQYHGYLTETLTAVQR